MNVSASTWRGSTTLLARLPGDAAGEHTRLARTRAREDRERRGAAGDRVALRRVETAQEVVHAGARYRRGTTPNRDANSPERGRPRVVSAASQLGSPRGHSREAFRPRPRRSPPAFSAASRPPPGSPGLAPTAWFRLPSPRGWSRSTGLPHRLHRLAHRTDARAAKSRGKIRPDGRDRDTRRRSSRWSPTRSTRSRPSSATRWTTSWWWSRTGRRPSSSAGVDGNAARPLRGRAAHRARPDLVRGRRARSHHGVQRAALPARHDEDDLAAQRADDRAARGRPLLRHERRPPARARLGLSERRDRDPASTSGRG